MKEFLAVTILAFSLAVWPGVAHAGKHDPMVVPDYQAVTASNGATPGVGRIKEAILASAGKRRWDVISDVPGKITLRYAPRTHEVVVAVNYDEKGFKIEYVSSENMNHEVKKGRPWIHGNYNKWINTLSGDIKNSSVWFVAENG